MGIRIRKRERGECELYSCDSPLGVVFVRKISRVEGYRLEQKGAARRVRDGDEDYVFQLTGACELPKALPLVVDAGSPASSTTLNRTEVEAAVGFFGESRTAGLNAAQRETLERMKHPTHDFVERSQIKLNAFRPRRVEAVACSASR